MVNIESVVSLGFPPVPNKLLWMIDVTDRKEATEFIHDYAVSTVLQILAGGWVLANRDSLADLVVRSACETYPSDPDDPDTIMIRTHDLRVAALSAMLIGG